MMTSWVNKDVRSCDSDCFINALSDEIYTQYCYPIDLKWFDCSGVLTAIFAELAVIAVCPADNVMDPKMYRIVVKFIICSFIRMICQQLKLLSVDNNIYGFVKLCQKVTSVCVHPWVQPPVAKQFKLFFVWLANPPRLSVVENFMSIDRWVLVWTGARKSHVLVGKQVILHTVLSAAARARGRHRV